MYVMTVGHIATPSRIHNNKCSIRDSRDTVKETRRDASLRCAEFSEIKDVYNFKFCG